MVSDISAEVGIADLPLGLSATLELAPRPVTVDLDIAGQAEHPFGNDVLIDFRRARLDGVGQRPQERVPGVRATERVGIARVVGCPVAFVAGVQEAVRTQQVHSQRGDLLVQFRTYNFGDRPLRSRAPVSHRYGAAYAGEPICLGPHPQPDELVAAGRIVVLSLAPGPDCFTDRPRAALARRWRPR